MVLLGKGSKPCGLIVRGVRSRPGWVIFRGGVSRPGEVGSGELVGIAVVSTVDGAQDDGYGCGTLRGAERPTALASQNRRGRRNRRSGRNRRPSRASRAVQPRRRLGALTHRVGQCRRRRQGRRLRRSPRAGVASAGCGGMFGGGTAMHAVRTGWRRRAMPPQHRSEPPPRGARAALLPLALGLLLMRRVARVSRGVEVANQADAQAPARVWIRVRD